MEKARLLVLLLAASAGMAQAQEALPDKVAIIQQAQQLLASQKSQEAYQLLRKAESRFGGDPQFNLLLGRAALAAERPAEAVFALERAVAVKPDFPQARAELGRAYFYLGENASARDELNAVQREDNLPPAVQANLQKFLDAIKSRFDASGRRLEYYLRMGGGNDSNINSAPDLSEILIPLFAALGPTQLGASSRELESGYTVVEPGIRYSHPLSSNLNLYASADINDRNATEAEADAFSTRTTNAVLGLGRLAGSNQYRAALTLQSFTVAEDVYREQAGINLEWQKILDGNDRLSTFVQYAVLSYPDLEFRDGDQVSGGVTWMHGFRTGVLYSGLYAGDEAVDDPARQFLAREFAGARVGGQLNWGRHFIFANLNFLTSEYGAQDTLFLVTREEDYRSLNLGMQFFLMSAGRVDWRLIPEINISSNESNIGIYEFERTAFGLTARADF
ncbi:MAG TPA: tetratricopeptide repeat protein [Gammaproteobacteria bacterium]|nr:tetratricopeptide repeat protein [Gammaproteobacteria bacterium]